MYCPWTPASSNSNPANICNLGMNGVVWALLLEMSLVCGIGHRTETNGRAGIFNISFQLFGASEAQARQAQHFKV